MNRKTPRKAGRPPLPKGNAKVGTLRVRVTPDELRAIESKAKASKQTVSEWIRGTLNATL
jgi:predicted HicB family RNase H-like nuclease